MILYAFNFSILMLLEYSSLVFRDKLRDDDDSISKYIFDCRYILSLSNKDAFPSY